MALKDPDHGIAKILSALGADKEALSGHGQGEGLGLGRALCLGGGPIMAGPSPPGIRNLGGRSPRPVSFHAEAKKRLSVGALIEQRDHGLKPGAVVAQELVRQLFPGAFQGREGRALEVATQGVYRPVEQGFLIAEAVVERLPGDAASLCGPPMVVGESRLVRSARGTA